MSNEIYVVTAATGNIGSKLATLLLNAKKKVRVVGRDAKRLDPFVKKGAEAAVADVENAAAVANIFSGAKAVFLLIPPKYGAPQFRAYQNQVADAYVAGIKAAHVSHAVSLSSLGAELADKTGPITGLYDFEQKLNKTDANVVHLRSGFFMENLLFNVALIKSAGINGSPLKPDLPISMIATRDIAEAAAELLIALNFSGKSTRELLGPRNVTMKEATQLVGKAIGKPDLAYVPFSYEDAEKAMGGAGFSPDAARLMAQMYQAMNEGLVKPSAPRSAISATPTTIEDFVPSVFVPTFQGPTPAHV